MIRLALIRHGATAWSAEHRLQGRRDLPLSPEGEAEVRAWQVPPLLAGWAWVTSPLARARETARLLHPGPITLEPALIEMDFGAWEGRPTAELSAEETAGGRHMTPPGGESPAMVQARLLPWLAGLQADTVAVAHKGVIRAVLGLATSWDFLGRPPARLNWRAAHLFAVTGSQVAILDLNRPLA